MNWKVLYCFLWVAMARSFLFAQDPFGMSFQTQRAMINPSFVGITGVESIQMNAKMQWNNFGDASDRYQTLSVLIEEPLPCTRLLDIGIKLLHDQEGKARYKTTELGFLSSITITPVKTKFIQHNIRIGGDFSFGRNSLDFSNLIFSDQLDPKYGIYDKFGNLNPTAFVAPGSNQGWYFNPGFGVSYIRNANATTHRSYVINTGMAAYRAYGTINTRWLQYNSLTGIATVDPWRVTAHFLYEKNYAHLNSNLSKIKFFVVYQNQGGIDYVEIGARVGVINNRLGLVSSLHFTPLSQYTNNTKWVDLMLEYKFKPRQGRLVEMNLSYGHNIGGLSNTIGPILGLGFAYRLNKSTLCKLDNIYDVNCYDLTLPENWRIYENVWYKD